MNNIYSLDLFLVMWSYTNILYAVFELSVCWQCKGRLTHYELGPTTCDLGGGT